MALTYEDMNCPSAGEFDRTAEVLLKGIRDYLGLAAAPVAPFKQEITRSPEEFATLDAYPNPVSSDMPLKIDIRLKYDLHYNLSLYNILGQRVLQINEGSGYRGDLNFTPLLKGLTTGVYYLVLDTSRGRKTVPLIFLNK